MSKHCQTFKNHQTKPSNLKPSKLQSIINPGNFGNSFIQTKPSNQAIKPSNQAIIQSDLKPSMLQSITNPGNFGNSFIQTKPSNQAIKPSNQAIKPSNQVIKPLILQNPRN
jgi:hypothetical protein